MQDPGYGLLRTPLQKLFGKGEGRSMTYAPEHGKVLFERSLRW
jgi:hypothetical protein